MKIYIYGYAGNMGQRYRAILDVLGHEWFGQERVGGLGDPKNADAFLIATPTSTHLDLIREASQYGKPILCEKPVSKDLPALRVAMEDCRARGVRLQIVSQYDELLEQGSVPPGGPTHYDYFRTGQDGLWWDCLNIVHLAKGTVTLGNKSPYWTCAINGKSLSLASMDWAYVAMIRKWLENPRDDIDRILASHKKVAKLEAEWAAKF